MILLIAALFGAFFLTANFAYAQVPGGGKGKASLQLLEKMDAGTSQDFIVVYDDKAMQEEAQILESEMGLASHHNRMIEHKAARYAEKKQEIHSAFGSHEATVLKHYSHLPLNFVRIHSRDALDRLLAHPGVVGVYEDTVERLALAESLPLVGQPQVAAQGNLGAGTAIAVLDTGVNYTNSAFGSCTSPGLPANCKVVYAQDFAPSDGKLDEDGHGTNVAGIVLGVAPGTKIVALDVFSGSTASGSDIIAAVDWVIAHKATYNIVAMNLSLGSGNYTSPVTGDPYYVAVHNARAAGILTVAAAGNDGFLNALSSPAATSGVVSVGAVYDSQMGPMYWGDPLRCQDITTAAEKVSCFSNSASFLTLLAPGSQILAAGVTQGGTSQAAPHVAGAVAVLRAAFPSETLDQIVARLTNGVMVIDSRNGITKPRLNLQMAIGVATSCAYAISETSKSFGSNSSTGSIAVTTGAGCTWGAASITSSSSWLTVTSGNSGTGNGTVSYALSENIDTTSRTGTLTVAGKTYTVTQSGSVGAVANILRNSGFESGPVSWTDQTANGYPVITAFLNPTTINSWYAWLCGYDNCVDSLYQDVTIPADAQGAVLQFNYWINTSETTSVTAYDSMAVRIFSPPTANTYATCTPLSNLNPTTDWAQSTGCNLIGYKGQTIRIQFAATTDSQLPTDFFVDDVTLMVSKTNYTLTVVKAGAGTGTVTSNPAGIACGADCSESYASGAVTLIATPTTGSAFAGWSGACTGTGACAVTMDAAKSVTATFINAVSGGEEFPLGGAIPVGWIQPSGSNAAWVGTNDAAYAGTLSLKSRLIGHNQKSEISYTANFSAGNVSFAGKVSSEANFDFLEFYIDGVLKGSWSGEWGWSVVSFPISAGTHTLLWRYVKDGSLIEGSDAAWIDSVLLPGTATIFPSSQSAGAGGLAGTVSVTAATGSAWTATSNASWIGITSGSNGSGSGTVAYSVAANTGTSSRTGTLTIGGQTFTVTQAGTSSSCASALSPTSSYISSLSGTGSVTVTTTSSCPWTGASNASWISVTSGASGIGNGTVGYSVTANTSTSSRTGSLTIGGIPFTVTQNGTSASANVNQVQTMYIAYFGRPADPAGLAYYSNLMVTQNGSYAAMLDDFWNSTESQGLYNQSTVSTKVNQVYRFLFSRDADASGLAYWSGLIANGQVTLPSVAYTIAFNAQPADAAILSAKQSAAATFTAHVDTTREIQAYANSVATGRAWLSPVVDSTTAATAIANVDATIAGM